MNQYLGKKIKDLFKKDWEIKIKLVVLKGVMIIELCSFSHLLLTPNSLLYIHIKTDISKINVI